MSYFKHCMRFLAPAVRLIDSEENLAALSRARHRASHRYVSTQQSSKTRHCDFNYGFMRFALGGSVELRRWGTGLQAICSGSLSGPYQPTCRWEAPAQVTAEIAKLVGNI
jgi:hypothetical protein